MAPSADEVRERLRAQIASIETGSPSVSMEVEDAENPRQPKAEFEKVSDLDRDDLERAFRKVERLACSREQASEALRRRLVREGFHEEVVEAAIARALACGLVDDRRYADVLVRSRLSQGKGRRGIAAELAGLGINPEGVEALTSGASIDDDASEVDRALAVLNRKPPRAKNRRDAAYRRLAQKGFGASVASTAARLWCEANPE